MAGRNGTSSAVDADAWVAALERPQLTIRGRVHQGRLLSYPEWIAFEERIQLLVRHEQRRVASAAEYAKALEADPATPPPLPESQADGWHFIARDFCMLAFPLPWWAFWRPSVAARVLSLPPATMFEVLHAFFECQGRSNRMMTDPATPTRTRGTPSPA